MASPRPESVDPCRCPLCGEDNDCGMAKGKATCWCFFVTIPRDVLDRVPAEAKGIACVCRACAIGGKGRPGSRG
ncbi:MAG TPA: cysteine-rich CWC family protein [Vicinamibacteria bacterium]|nr:cysteine-rich CWC family protein [Vicinamibacteria bacterium]